MNSQQEKAFLEIRQKLNEMTMQFDSTLLAAALSTASAQLWRALIAVKKETPNSVQDIYALTLACALEPAAIAPQIQVLGRKETLQ